MKNACCFFGHRDTPRDIFGKLEKTIDDLIERKGVDAFCIGNQGCFDVMARAILKKLKEKYARIRYSVVLAYMPSDKQKDYSDTIYPDGLENEVCR